MSSKLALGATTAILVAGCSVAAAAPSSAKLPREGVISAHRAASNVDNGSRRRILQENDECGSSAVVSSLPFQATGSTEGSTPDFASASCGAGADANGVWYSHVPSATGEVRATVNQGQSLRVYSGGCGALACVSQSDVVQEFVADAGVEYRFLVSSVGPSSSYVLSVEEVPTPAPTPSPTGTPSPTTASPAATPGLGDARTSGVDSSEDGRSQRDVSPLPTYEGVDDDLFEEEVEEETTGTTSATSASEDASYASGSKGSKSGSSSSTSSSDGSDVSGDEEDEDCPEEEEDIEDDAEGLEENASSKSSKSSSDIFAKTSKKFHSMSHSYSGSEKSSSDHSSMSMGSKGGKSSSGSSMSIASKSKSSKSSSGKSTKCVRGKTTKGQGKSSKGSSVSGPQFASLMDATRDGMSGGAHLRYSSGGVLVAGLMAGVVAWFGC